MQNLQNNLIEAVQNLGFGVTEGSNDWKYLQRPNKLRLGGVKFLQNSVKLVLDAKKDTTLDRLLTELVIQDKVEESHHNSFAFSIYDEYSLTKAIDLMTLASSMPQDMRVKLK